MLLYMKKTIKIDNWSGKKLKFYLFLNVEYYFNYNIN